MDKSGRQPKAKKGTGKAKRPKGAGSRKPYTEADLLRALNHQLRRQILRLLHASKEPLSPAQLEETLELGEERKDELSSVSYHVTVLSRFKVISLVDEQPVRGAMEHFYASEVSKTRWVRDLLKRMRREDDGQLWPKGRGPGGKKAAGGKRRP